MGDEIRVAMIGGNGHHYITGAFGAIPDVRLVAMAADGHDDRILRYREEPYCDSSVSYFENYEDMLDAVKPDLVSVGCQPCFNAAATGAALERGIHVVSDKPIANSDDELARLKSLSAANPDCLLVTEFDMRAREVFAAARQTVQDGAVGQVVLVQAQKSYRFGNSRPDFYKSREGFPGTVVFIGSHVIDMAYWATGLRYTSVQGAQGNISKREYAGCEDHAALLFTLENGAKAVMHADYLRPAAAPTHGDDRIRIAGSKGIVEVRDERCVVMTQDRPPEEICTTPRDHGAMAREVIAMVRGQGSGIFSNADSLYIAAILLKAREAVDTGMVITFG